MTQADGVKVTLDANGGLFKDDTAVIEDVIVKGTEFLVQDNDSLGLEKEGYTFNGWINTTTSENIGMSGTFTIDESTTFKADWIKVEVPEEPTDPVKPAEPVKPSDPVKPQTPTTGINNNESIYFTMLIVSLGGLLIVRKNKYSKDKNI